MSEQERMTARACLKSLNETIEELRALPAWWAWMSERNRCEVKEFQALVLMQLNALE